MKKPILTVIKRAIVQELFKADKTPLEILKEVPDITALKLEAFFYPLGILTEDELDKVFKAVNKIVGKQVCFTDRTVYSYDVDRREFFKELTAFIKVDAPGSKKVLELLAANSVDFKQAKSIPQELEWDICNILANEAKVKYLESKRSQEPVAPENVNPTDIMITLKGAAAIRVRAAADVIGLSVPDFIKQAVAKEVNEFNSWYE
jgi:hypothetical protein